MHTSWVGQGHKMNLGFEITGTKGAIKFDQERMGEFHLFEMHDDDIATNGYKPFWLAWHAPFGASVQLRGIMSASMKEIIEAGEFVRAILEDDRAFPDFEEGLVYEQRSSYCGAS